VPADLADERQLLALLDASRIGIKLSDEGQLWPDQSTSPIVLHHMAAAAAGLALPVVFRAFTIGAMMPMAGDRRCSRRTADVARSARI
jgi:hypothetical protein